MNQFEVFGSMWSTSIVSAPCTEIEGLAGTAVITFPVDSGSCASGAASSPVEPLDLGPI
jgi:hypothetical protein